MSTTTISIIYIVFLLMLLAALSAKNDKYGMHAQPRDTDMKVAVSTGSSTVILGSSEMFGIVVIGAMFYGAAIGYHVPDLWIIPEEAAGKEQAIKITSAVLWAIGGVLLIAWVVHGMTFLVAVGILYLVCAIPYHYIRYDNLDKLSSPLALGASYLSGPFSTVQEKYKHWYASRRPPEQVPSNRSTPSTLKRLDGYWHLEDLDDRHADFRPGQAHGYVKIVEGLQVDIDPERRKNQSPRDFYGNDDKILIVERFSTPIVASFDGQDSVTLASKSDSTQKQTMNRITAEDYYHANKAALEDYERHFNSVKVRISPNPAMAEANRKDRARAAARIARIKNSINRSLAELQRCSPESSCLK